MFNVQPYTRVGGFAIQAKAKMNTLDFSNQSFDVIAEILWSAIVVMSGIVAATAILGQYILKPR